MSSEVTFDKLTTARNWIIRARRKAHWQGLIFRSSHRYCLISDVKYIPRLRENESISHSCWEGKKGTHRIAPIPSITKAILHCDCVVLAFTERTRKNKTINNECEEHHISWIMLMIWTSDLRRWQWDEDLRTWGLFCCVLGFYSPLRQSSLDNHQVENTNTWSKQIETSTNETMEKSASYFESI